MSNYIENLDHDQFTFSISIVTPTPTTDNLGIGQRHHSDRILLPSSSQTRVPQMEHHPSKSVSISTFGYPLPSCMLILDGYYNMYDPAVTYATSLPQWCSTSLVQLSIDTGEPFHFSLQNLPTLRELSFGKSMHNCWIGDILEQWILQPRACPALRKLTFKGRCKEWDLLFLILERRNFLKDPTISPTQEIEIMPT
ncbi:hypothetical protein FRC15_005069 [Serendipita sp. 397]|nr:hypothetical protein FRC15_005069 [Serendipita sp. 397]